MGKFSKQQTLSKTNKCYFVAMQLFYQSHIMRKTANLGNQNAIIVTKTGHYKQACRSKRVHAIDTSERGNEI